MRDRRRRSERPGADRNLDPGTHRGGRRARQARLKGAGGGASGAEPPPTPPWSRRRRTTTGSASAPYKYIEWPDGEKELYDINKDPYELNNIVRNGNYAPIRNFMHNELVRLEECSGRTCQEVAENSR